MTLAQDPPTPGSLQSIFELADAAATGLVRVDLAGTAWALNPAGVLLLEAIGGADGTSAPAVLADALGAAALDGFPTNRETAAMTPESRRISVTALVRDE